ncbi:uncharacterized protein [Amphiura filiformis]|uniref:uncharacterized protein n=1 Tax=Amphiura filiformis TaxID=82378 RepID=UPI003B2234F8
MSQQRGDEFSMDKTRQLWQIGVGRRKSTPKRHYVDDAEVVPESIKRLCYEEEEEEDHVECQGCKQKQSEVSQLKREVAQLLRLTEYQQDEIDKLKKDLTQTNRRNEDLQRRVIDKMDNLAVIVTNSTPTRSSTPPRESPRPSSPSSQHLGIPMRRITSI